MSNSNLDENLKEKLLQFQEVTLIQDLGTCRAILQQHEWNVEKAVQSTFGDFSFNATKDIPKPNASNVTIEVPVGMRHRRQIRPPNARRDIFLPERTPSGGHSMGVGDLVYLLFFFPFHFALKKIVVIFGFLFRLFFADPREKIIDPHGDVITFVLEFQAKYCNQLKFFDGTYGKAKEEAKKQLKFLIVYLHDPCNAETERFCNAALCHKNVIEYINEKAVLWGCSVSKPEGYRVSKIIRNPTYPLIAMICQHQNRMMIVGRSEGFVTATVLLKRLKHVIETYDPILATFRADKQTRRENLLIRQEQDEAYLEAQRRDQEKINQRNKEKEEENKLQAREKEILKNKENKINLCGQKKARCKEEIKPEPGGVGENVFDLVIKLPDGTRLRRKFMCTNTVKTLHDYIYAQDTAPSSFQVFTNFPRRLIRGCSSNTIHDTEIPLLRDVGLSKSDTLFVQELHSEDEEESDEDDRDSQ